MIIWDRFLTLWTALGLCLMWFLKRYVFASADLHLYGLLLFFLYVYAWVWYYYERLVFPVRKRELYTQLGPQHCHKWMLDALSIPFPVISAENKNEERDIKIRFVRDIMLRALSIAQQYLPQESVVKPTKAFSDLEKYASTSQTNQYLNALLKEIWKDTPRTWLWEQPMKVFVTPPLLVYAFYVFLVWSDPYESIEESGKWYKAAAHPVSFFEYKYAGNDGLKNLAQSFRRNNVDMNQTECFRIRRSVPQSMNENITRVRLQNWLTEITHENLKTTLRVMYYLSEDDAENRTVSMMKKLNPKEFTAVTPEWTDAFTLRELEFLLVTWAFFFMSLGNIGTTSQIWNVTPTAPKE